MGYTREIDGDITIDTDTGIGSDSQETLRSLMSTVAEGIRIATEPFRLMNAFMESFRPLYETIRDGLRLVSAIYKPALALSILADNQYVVWKDMEDDLIDEIVASKDVNRLLNKRLLSEDYSCIYKTVRRCQRNKKVSNRELLRQTIKSMEYGYYDIAVNALVSIIDDTLTNVSNLNTTRIKRRVDAIFKMIENKQELSEADEMHFSLFITLNKAMSIYGESVGFDEMEPDGLNRHWIAHGRSRRKMKMLDCAKLINMLYGILLLDEICEACGE